MSYRLPGVNVHQILMRASQALADSELLPCLVGPLYQVVKDSAITLTLPIAGSTTVVYPSLKVGAIIENSSISIKVKNAKIAIIAPLTAITGLTFTAGNPTVTSTTTTFTNVKAGDILQLSGNAGTYTVLSVGSDFKSVTFTSNVNYVPSAQTYGVSRSVGDVIATIGSPTYTATNFSFTSLTYGPSTITSGTGYISYVALRRDLLGFYEVTDQSTLALDMDIDPLNPLGFNAGLVAPAASGGRNILLYILSDYTEAEYLAAYEQLSVRRDSYFIVPILNTGANTQTFNNSIMTAASSNAIAMSDPSISYFRSAFVITPLVDETTLTHATYTVGV